MCLIMYLKLINNIMKYKNYILYINKTIYLLINKTIY